MKTSISKLGASLLLLIKLTSLAAVASDGAAAVPALPTWQVLEYKQQAFFVTAKSRLEIVADPENDSLWQLTASSSVANNSEQLTLDFAAADGSASYRSRLSKGKQQRYKSYEFLPQHILRIRRDPPAKAESPPCEWPLSSRKEIPYPAAVKGMVVTDAYALLALAGRFLASGDDTAELVVHTEFNFYKVRMGRNDNSPEIKVNYQPANAPAAVTGKRRTRGVTLQISPLGEPAEKYDFSLLGLNGDIAILFDEQGELPLQLRGSAPRIGKTEIDLTGLTRREPAP